MLWQLTWAFPALYSQQRLEAPAQALGARLGNAKDPRWPITVPRIFLWSLVGDEGESGGGFSIRARYSWMVGRWFRRGGLDPSRLPDAGSRL